jgi:hypothetical protein
MKKSLTCAVDTDGISGSWIFRESEYRVQIYGQVVAKDGFGSLHVVPIVDILQDIKWVFKVDMVYLYGHNIVSKEIGPTSLPRFVSHDPKHGNNQSDAANDGASSGDTIRVHPRTQAHTINSSVEFHIPPGSLQGRPTQAASSQSERIADNSMLGHYMSISRDYDRKDSFSRGNKGDSVSSSRLENSSYDTPHRTRERREKDNTTMLSKALQMANTAVLLDNAQNLEGAMEAYKDACKLLQQVVIRTSPDEDRRKLNAIVSIL